jgi:hypothetical protein
MPIKNITDRYRPQRSGKIHLGVKSKKTLEGGKVVEYPSEVNYFVLRDAPELLPFYGPDPEDRLNPKKVHLELRAALPSTRFERGFPLYLEKVFPQYLKRYTAAGLHCKGDGEMAVCLNEETGALEEQPCPCEFLDSGDCKRIGILRIRVRDLPTFNIYQITTSSFNSIMNMNGFLRDLWEHCIVHGIDISDVKLLLKRVPATVQRLESESGSGKKKKKLSKSTHYLLSMDLDPAYYKTLDDVHGRPILPPGYAKKELDQGQIPIGYDYDKVLPPVNESADPLYLQTGFQPDHADAPSSESAQPQAQDEKKKLEKKTSGLHDLGAEQGFPEGPAGTKAAPPAQPQGSALFKEDLEIEEEKKTLMQVVDEYLKLGGKLTQAVLEKIDKFKTKEEYSIAIGYYRAQASKRRKRKTRPEGL